MTALPQTLPLITRNDGVLYETTGAAQALYDAAAELHQIASTDTGHSEDWRAGVRDVAVLLGDTADAYRDDTERAYQ